MTKLALGAAVYFDHELAADPRPLVQVTALVDAQLMRSHWGDVIRGPEWGTFLSAAHVAKLGGIALPVARTVPLASGGAFVQTTAEAFAVEAPPPALSVLREALAPVLSR